MFHQIRTKIRVSGKRCQRLSFGAIVIFLMSKDVEFAGLSNCYLEILKFWIFFRKFWKYETFFFFWEKSTKFWKFWKNRNICKRCMIDKYVYKISSLYLQKCGSDRTLYIGIWVTLYASDVITWKCDVINDFFWQQCQQSPFCSSM